MFKIYFRTGLRNLMRQKSFTLINLTGLTVGLSSIMVLSILLYQYLTANGQFSNKQRMYYVKAREGNGPEEMQTPYPFLYEVEKRAPQIVAATHIQSWRNPWISANGKEFQEDSWYVDKDFFKVFSYPLEAGNPELAMHDKYSVVLSHDLAQKLFGQEDALGKTVNMDDSIPLKVTGILQPIPSNTAFRPDVLLTTALLRDEKGFASNADWYNTLAENYLLLAPGADTSRVNTIMNEVVQTHYHADNRKTRVRLVPYSQFVQEESGSLVQAMVKGIMGMIIFILLVVVANLFNLNMATLFQRNREVAVRKMIGSTSWHILLQFCIENAILIVVSIIMAFLLMQSLLLPAINDLINGKFGEITLHMQHDYPLAIGFILIGVCVIIVVSSYPAWHLNALKVTNAIKGKLGSSYNKQHTRNIFITMQFLLATTFIGITIILSSQIRHMKQASLGFDKDNILLVNMGLSFKDHAAAKSRFDVLLNDLRSNPYVQGISTSEDYPTNYMANYDTYYDPASNRELHFRHAYTDAGLLSTYRIPLVEGRDFINSDDPLRLKEIIINKKAMQMMGWKEPVVGRELREKGGNESFTVVGVMDDFHYQDQTRNIEPLIHHYGGKQQLGFTMLSVRVDPNHEKEVLARLTAAFKEMPSRQQFKYEHLAERVDHQYTMLEGILKATNFVALMTVLIAAMGLFGLVALFTRQRVKEIGIRKVLGASPAGIVALLSRNFLLLVCIAMLVSVPLCWLVMDHWLKDFANRIDIQWWMLLLAGLIACGIASLTVGYHAVRAALANPVKSLRAD